MVTGSKIVEIMSERALEHGKGLASHGVHSIITPANEILLGGPKYFDWLGNCVYCRFSCFVGDPSGAVDDPFWEGARIYSRPNGEMEERSQICDPCHNMGNAASESGTFKPENH